MKRILFPTLITLVLAGCNKDIANNTPKCIRKEIVSRKDDEAWMIVKVDEYVFQGKKVYAYEPSNRIADASTEIKDENCNTLCHVGGFGGPAVNLCSGQNFFQSAVFKRNIWTRK